MIPSDRVISAMSSMDPLLADRICYVAHRSDPTDPRWVAGARRHIRRAIVARGRRKAVRRSAR